MDVEAPEEPPLHPWLDDPPTVGAVLVVHHGERWLPKVLTSLAALSHRPNAWRVVDVSSTGRGAELVRDSFGAERVVYAPSGTGFGDAIRLGAESLPETDWIWLLHDDAIVDPDILLGLLDEATTADDIAVVGPKVREWPSLKRLLEVGLTLTTTGVRETGLEPGEPDAGQHDWPEDVLAVGSAGMLVRRSVWDELGGFDPDLPLFGDDLDFGWRVALAGHRTRTAPGGVIFHAEASRRRQRPRAAGDPEPWERRRGALHTVLTNTRGPRLAWTSVRLLLGSLLRVLGFGLAKDTEAAGDELRAVRSVFGHPGRLRAARRRKSATTRVGHRQVRHLLAPWWLPYRHAVDTVRHVAVALVRPEDIETVGRRSTVGEQSPDDTDDLDDGPPLWRRRPWLVTVLVLVLASLVAGRGLVAGDGPLAGGALPPAPDSVADWWQLMLERSHAVGLGSDGLGPVYAGVLALVGLPLWWSPDLVVTALMILSVPFAALTAHRLGRLLTDRRGPRMVWAVGYALAVAATGAVGQGRLGTVVALVALPIAVNTGVQLYALPGWRLALRVALWVAVAGAFAPVVVPMALVAFVAAVGLRLLRREDALVIAVVTVLLLGPWIATRALRPTRWWWEAGYPVPGAGDALDVLLGRAGVVGAPAWLTVPVLVLGVLALIPARTRDAVVRCWVVAGIGLVFALLGTLTTFGTPSGAQGVTAWVAVPTVVWVAALGTAVLVVAVQPPDLPRRALAGLALAALVMPVGTAAWWLVDGTDGPVQRGDVDVVPEFLTQRPGDTLVITGTVEDGIRTRVVRASGPFLGQEALSPPAERSDRLQAAVSRLLTRPSADDVSTLGSLGVEAIYAPDVDPGVADRIDAVPDLERSGSDSPDSRVWTLATEPRIDDPVAPAWRTAVAGVLGLVWVAAIVATAPVRRRDVTPDEPDELEEDAAPVRIAT